MNSFRGKRKRIEKRKNVPIVKIEMLEGRTKQQKAELVQAVTQALVQIAKTKPESVTVVFSEYPKENWAQGGKLLSD